MLKRVFCLAITAALTCCASSGPSTVGETTGNILRAPVDFFAGLGRGVTGKSHMPLREFRQNWEVEQADPDFWESDQQFFRDVK